MSRTEKVLTTNLKNLTYNILKTSMTMQVCIEKHILLSKQLTCTFPDCGKSIEVLEEFATTETEPRHDSESSTSLIVGKMGKQFTIQSQEIIEEEMMDVDNGKNKDNDSKGATEETTTTQDKSSNKKAKPTKPLDREKSLSLLMN
ncbi:hypothetical protein Glove_382g27 [Diversispora epigaea]|uniref:Uncharacterized protein n=1 Tax=Diversispora epigaea TaxID=1348612 RepID=A0A397H443_9GLOM|nr:hypothetical protein Glove_382g27 [Diversispora epigaea]